MKLLYFAWLRQKTGISEEDLTLPSEVTNLRQLTAFLAARGNGYAEIFGDLKLPARGCESRTCRLRHADQAG